MDYFELAKGLLMDAEEARKMEQAAYDREIESRIDAVREQTMQETKN